MADDSSTRIAASGSGTAAASAASDKHLWFTNPSGSAYRYLVAAVSNFRWPLASAKPQVAVCGFFKTLEEAQAYQARHQQYKPGTNPQLPRGPIFLCLETCRLFPMAASPQRLFGAEVAALARKRDAIIRNYYRIREIEKQEVAARKGKEDTEPGVGKVSEAEIKKDARLRRGVLRRARRHAWEVLQRLETQLIRVERMRGILKAREEAEKDSEDVDPELLDLLEKLTPLQRKQLMGGAPAAKETAAAGEGEGESDAASLPTATNTINPTPNTKLGTIEQFIEWAKQHFKSQGIEPASDDMMDEEERREEEAAMLRGKEKKRDAAVAGADSELQAGAGAGAGAAVESSAAQSVGSLPAAPAGQAFCIGTIFHDTTSHALNKAMPDAAGKEHVVAFFEPYPTAEEAKTALQNIYTRAFSEESMFYVRVGHWCCFDNVTEDDGEQIYREDTMQEMFEGHLKNAMLQFIEESFSRRPDVIPIPTAK